MLTPHIALSHSWQVLHSLHPMFISHMVRLPSSHVIVDPQRLQPYERVCHICDINEACALSAQSEQQLRP